MSAMTRQTITVEELRIGDWKQTGSDFITRVRSIEPYWTGPEPTGFGTPLHIDHRYLVVNNVIPPLALEDAVEVWRAS